LLILILQLVNNLLMESPFDGAGSLLKVQKSVSGVDHNPPSTSRPPLGASRNQGPSFNHHSEGKMKDTYEEAKNVEQHDNPNGKSDYASQTETFESCLVKNISTIETKLCISDDSTDHNSVDILESDNGILGSSKQVIDQKNSEITFCSSPQNSLYSTTDFLEAKESFTNTGITECVSVDKSVESGEVTNSGESRKTSICRGSTGSDVSDESSISSLSSSMYKPHKANDVRWEAIQAIRVRDGGLEMRHFRLLKKLGCGDIGSVYLAELSSTRTCFAMKVMNKTELSSRKKLPRAQTEREILQSLDHPFLPSLYTHFETESFSCLVMEFCPGGDLHALRQRQPGKYFSEHAARLAFPFSSLYQ